MAGWMIWLVIGIVIGYVVGALNERDAWYAKMDRLDREGTAGIDRGKAKQ